MKENIVQIKSYSFSLRMVKLYKYLCERKNEFVLSKQIVRSGTSIGANSEEAIGAQSRKDFIAKISIAYKEARETHYWIRIISDSGYISQKQSDSLLLDLEELHKLLTTILKSSKNKIHIIHSYNFNSSL